MPEQMTRLQEYRRSGELAAKDYPFASHVVAMAMRCETLEDEIKIHNSWPNLPSRYDLQRAVTIGSYAENTFRVILWAAMRKADSLNMMHITRNWPELAAELRERYHAPAGLLPGETDSESGLRCRADGILEQFEPEPQKETPDAAGADSDDDLD
jgi:hypothetical protein